MKAFPKFTSRNTGFHWGKRGLKERSAASKVSGFRGGRPGLCAAWRLWAVFVVDVNYPDRRVASRGNVTPLFDVVFPVFISHSESQSNCLRRAFRNERVARLEASPARSPMMRRCSHVGHKTCRFEQSAQDHLLGALGTPFLDSTL